MTYTEICQKLQSVGVAEYRYEAALLLRRYCGVERSELPFMRDKNFESAELAAAIHLRTRRYPLQYILGEWHFCNEVYKVGPSCLIPREETELLVLKAAELLPSGARFVDLCTGSGCIAVSLLAARADCTADAVELSPDALDYAKRNAELNGVADRVRFTEADVLNGELPAKLFKDGSLDAVLSNPPYIPDREIETLEAELAYEPRIALAGGQDGLDFYRVLIRNYATCLKPNGFMLFEIGHDQGEAIAELSSENKFSCTVEKDLAGHDRLALLRRV